jgi:hypothetical protein
VKFEKDFSLVSCLSTMKIPRSVWYLYSGASCHMTKAHELFISLTENDSGIYVDVRDDSKYV